MPHQDPAVAADRPVVECHACAATLADGAAWCGQCYAVVPAAGPSPVPARVVVAARPPAVRRTTRWGRSAVTFGPVGRIVATILLLVPAVFFVFAGMFWAGGFIWIFILVPWALRDIWRTVQLRTR